MSELLLHPAWLLIAAAIVVRVAPRPVGDAVMVLAPLGALWQILTLGRDTTVTATYLAFDVVPLRADALSYPFALIFAAVAIVAGIYGIRIQRNAERMAVLITVAAGIGVVYAGDLMTFFLFWEIKAVASTFVILARRTDGARRAGMRYLFVHIVGGKILLAGVLLHLATTGSLAFEAFDPSLAAWLILLACAVNAAIPPLHAWLKDGYPEASVAGMVFLSAFTTKSAVYALIRGFAGYEILLVMGVIMAIYGVTYAILENDVRRLLAYHIVSQVGFMVTAVGIGTEAALNGATAHAVAHILYKGLLLMGVGALLYATGRSKASALGGLANRMKPVLILYLIGAASISSVPLLSGFVSKELVIDAAYQEHLTWLVITLKVVSVGTFLSTGLKLPYAAWFGPQGAGPRTDDGAPFPVARLPITMFIAMGIAAAANLVLGLFPGLLYDIMPFAVDYPPYSVGKVVEKLQLLGFTALGFFLLLHKLGAKAVINLDTDAFYRLLPRAIAAAKRAAAQPSLAGPGVPVAGPRATASPAPRG
ncbi:MAG: Na(+)/H(+) antiporter subunit D, partial [Nitriliruptoraceae bacterium]|nr:Na(+)/H(+) antiporter subunit D [Nitriliruptoraceae bacterium]